MSFTRGELQAIRDRALQMAQQLGPSNILAMRAYAELAGAADKLDAMMAREEPVAVSAPPISRPVASPRTTQQMISQIELESDDEDEGAEYYVPPA